jgi:two-component system, OmpR family, sensor histidine kinase KdpD
LQETRPDPDALLAQVTEGDRPEGQGRLKVYLGMAAGVGKTYAMLSDGQEARRRGQDIVIGYLEPHGRAETEAMAEGLERLPPKVIDHRGVAINEFDVDAAIERRPELILVDELAHTNATGCRHTKRWQDIVELLDSGINVATTVNIQHVESLRDVVAQITGVFVKETVPDAFFERANEIELVDLPPEELQQRLHEGKIYVPEKVEQALHGFFKRGNLLALRELALRHTAERVEEDIRRSRTQTRETEPWHASERILVCIAPNRMAQRVVRVARRLANSLHAELLAVSVSSSRQGTLGDRAQADLDAAMRLAEELGARSATLSGDDIVAELIAYARQENVTTLVMGKPVRPRWKEVLFGSVVDHTVRASGNIDVLIITGEETQGTPLVTLPPKESFRWMGLVEAVLWIAAATGIGTAFGREIRHANIIMLYLVGVVAISLRYGRKESLASALLSVIAFNFFFVAPLHTFVISYAQDAVTFVVMLIVALILSSLTLRLKDQTKAASERERNTSVLYNLSRKLAGTRSKTEMATFAVEKVCTLIGAEAAVFRRATTGDVTLIAPSASGFEQSEKEKAVATWVVDHGRPAGATTDTLAGSQGLYLPLVGSGAAFGALAIDLSTRGELDIAKRHLLESVASQLATALERAQFAKSSHEAALRAESERMRGDLLSAVSHDLRTPLTSISGAASGMLDQPDLTDRTRELASTIQEESDRLARLVRNLLDMTRVQGVIELALDWHSVEELVGSAVFRTESLFDHPVKVEAAPGPILVKVDGLLMEQVLVNLLENASRHAGRESNIVIAIGSTRQIAWLEVRDDGPGVPKDQEQRIFERFKRHGSGGFGLGLAICKAAVEAHNGAIFVAPSAKGANFRIELPLTKEEDA